MLILDRIDTLLLNNGLGQGLTASDVLSGDRNVADGLSGLSEALLRQHVRSDLPGRNWLQCQK